MEKKNLKTINLQGKEYIQVNTRVEYFNQEYPNGQITTSYDKQEGNQYIFKATVTPDIDKPARFFTGTSHGEVSREKAMEKLETVAVGRALAFMGIGIVESLASADEIEKFMNDPVSQVTKGVDNSKIPETVVGGGTQISKDYLCPVDGEVMVQKTGKYGVFYSCKNYPTCKGTRNAYGQDKTK